MATSNTLISSSFGIAGKVQRGTAIKQIIGFLTNNFNNCQPLCPKIQAKKWFIWKNHSLLIECLLGSGVIQPTIIVLEPMPMLKTSFSA